MKIIKTDSYNFLNLKIKFQVIGGLSSGKIQIWDSASGQILQTLTGHTNTVMDLTIINNNQYLASASMDKKIIVWSLSTGNRFLTLTLHIDMVTSLDALTNGYLVSGNLNRKKNP